MDRNFSGPPETDEDILVLDFPDDALERAAAVTDERALTWAYCTHNWVICGWPF